MKTRNTIIILALALLLVVPTAFTQELQPIVPTVQIISTGLRPTRSDRRPQNGAAMLAQRA